MRDKKEAACCGKCADQALNMSGGKGSQRRRRFVKQEKCRLQRQCARKAQALLLPPRRAWRRAGEDGLALPPRVPRHTRPTGRVLPSPWLCGYPARARGAAHFPVWNRERRLDSEIPYPRAGAVSTTMAHCFLPVGDRQAREWRRNPGVSAPRVSQPGNSSFNRLNARRKVVFPDPDRPRIAVSPCAGKVPERSRMTTCPPKAMERLPMRARWGMRDPYFCSQASRRCWRSSGA